jgi:hypothetical protein
MENNNETNITESATAPVAPTTDAANYKKNINFVHNKISLSVLVLVIIATIFLVFALVQKTNTNTQIKPSAASPRSYIQSNLLLSTPVIDSNGNYTSNVEITTGSNKVNGVDIRLSYDPRALANVDIKPGTFFTGPVVLLKKVNIAQATVTYTLAVNPSQKSANGKGTVAVLSFSRIDSTLPIQINFLPQTEVTAVGYVSSVLNTSTGVTLSGK